MLVFLHTDPRPQFDFVESPSAGDERSPVAVKIAAGGLGGSGRHFSGEDSPGAQPSDRALGRRGGGGGVADPNLPVGNVPGATGYGKTNAYWRGALDKRGEGCFTGPKEMFDYLRSQGASENEALMLTGAASSESSFNPNAKHDPVNVQTLLLEIGVRPTWR